MGQSNTGHRNVTYDSTRDRYRCEMRVGKISRTARCKTLKAALEIRAAWAKERDEPASVSRSNRKCVSSNYVPVLVFSTGPIPKILLSAYL